MDSPDLKKQDDSSQIIVVSPLEYSNTSTTKNDVAPSTLPVLNERHARRVASGLIAFFTVGWGDSITGVILPDVQAQFHLGFTAVSMLFVAGSAGYAVATFLVEPSTNYLARFSTTAMSRSPFPLLFTIGQQKPGHSSSQGRCFSLLFYGLLHAAFFTIVALATSYPAVLVAFFIGGIGKSVLIAEINAFWISNPRVPGISVLHGVYGVGAFVSPLISQTLKAQGLRWQIFFWISLGVSLFNITFSLWAYHTTEKEFQRDKLLSLAFGSLTQTHEQPSGEDQEKTIGTQSKPRDNNIMRKTLMLPYMWWIAIFLCVYNGAEVITNGYIVSFLLGERNADKNVVGYVASGFWGGLALGRVLIGSISPRFSHRVKSIYVSIILLIGIGLHVLIWTIKNFYANAVFASLVGFLVGPTFPVVLDIGTRQLPRHISPQWPSAQVWVLWEPPYSPSPQE